MDFIYYRYTVGLWCKEKNVSESLVADGLAQYVGYSLPEFDFNILLEQQIRVTLSEMTALDNFVVTFSTHRLTCTLHNLANATEKREGVLQEFIGKTVIMYVDSVLEDR